MEDFKLVPTPLGQFMVPTSVPAFLTKMQRGGFELGKLRWFMKAAAKYFPGTRNGTFVDVGAHIGSTIIPAFQNEGVIKGVAIEPDPINAACLNASLTLSLGNGLVDVINAVAHEWTGPPIPFKVNPFHHGDGRVDGPADWETVMVPTVALDDLLPDEAPGWVWVDVQGWEAFVFEGMTGLMATHAFPIFFELCPGILRNLDRLLEIIDANFEGFIDIKKPGKVQSVEALPGLVEALTIEDQPLVHTDVLLLPF